MTQWFDVNRDKANTGCYLQVIYVILVCQQLELQCLNCKKCDPIFIKIMETAEFITVCFPFISRKIVYVYFKLD